MVGTNDDLFSAPLMDRRLRQTIHLQIAGDKSISCLDRLVLCQILSVQRTVDADLPQQVVEVGLHDGPAVLNSSKAIVYIQGQCIFIFKVSLGEFQKTVQKEILAVVRSVGYMIELVKVVKLQVA